MATATFPPTGFGRPVVPRSGGRRPSVLARLWAALSNDRRHEEAEIATYIEGRGGKITDALERDIERRFMFGRF